MKFFHRYKIGLVMISCLGAAAPSYAPNIYWQKWTIDTSGNGADGVYTGDINRDGLVDVVSGWEQSGDLRLYLNPGPATVRQTAAWSHVDISDGIGIEGIEDAALYAVYRRPLGAHSDAKMLLELIRAGLEA